MLFSLRKEKNERENDLLTTRGELNLLLNLPEDTQVQLSLDEEVLQQLDLSQLSFADLKAIINERPDQNDCPKHSECLPCKSETTEVKGPFPSSL